MLTIKTITVYNDYILISINSGKHNIADST